MENGRFSWSVSILQEKQGSPYEAPGRTILASLVVEIGRFTGEIEPEKDCCSRNLTRSNLTDRPCIPGSQAHLFQPFLLAFFTIMDSSISNTPWSETAPPHADTNKLQLICNLLKLPLANILTNSYFAPDDRICTGESRGIRRLSKEVGCSLGFEEQYSSTWLGFYLPDG